MMRLQKFLSQEGVLSRREAEAAIEKGLIKVNGEVAKIGQQIDPVSDVIELDETLKKQPIVIAFHKPKGIVTNCPLPDETEIKALLPPRFQSFSCIGRLDKESEGLILLTDSGVVANQALRQDRPHTRDYLVWVNHPFSSGQLERLEEGVEILGKKTLPVRAVQLGPAYCKLTLQEGRNRQIRRMMQKIGLFVVRLKRISFATIKLEDLDKGKYRTLSKAEIEQLLK